MVNVSTLVIELLIYILIIIKIMIFYLKQEYTSQLAARGIRAGVLPPHMGGGVLTPYAACPVLRMCTLDSVIILLEYLKNNLFQNLMYTFLSWGSRRVLVNE